MAVLLILIYLLPCWLLVLLVLVLLVLVLVLHLLPEFIVGCCTEHTNNEKQEKHECMY
jgi:uncharacterized protein (DUF58 family)